MDGLQRQARLPDLPPPRGPSRRGWYHCIPANVRGDEREELVLYNPWDARVWLYTPNPFSAQDFQGCRPTTRQYNARLMD